VKRLLINLLVGYSGFFAMFLNPEDHTGDRAALLIVAFLIVITNLQAQPPRSPSLRSTPR
jgi:hypothetical protein